MNKHSVNFSINNVIANTFSEAFSIPSILLSNCINIHKGTAIAHNPIIPAIPAKAPTPLLNTAPNMVNGINNNVNAEHKVINANILVIAFSTPFISLSNCINVHKGIANAVKPITPKAMLFMSPNLPIAVNAYNTPVIAANKTLIAIAFCIEF